MKENKKFELVIQLRDHFGNPTGKTKIFESDNSDELETFWLQNHTQKNSTKDEYNTRTNKNKRNTEKSSSRNESP